MIITEFLKALHDNLEPLATGGWTIHNEPLPQTQLPYIIFGYSSASEWGQKPCSLNSAVFLTDIHLWTSPNGFKTVSEKMDAVINAMKNISQPGLSFAKVVLVATPIIVEDDAVHGVVRMEIKAKED